MPFANIHGEITRGTLNISTTGDNIVVAAIANGEIFIHEIVGQPSASMVVTIKCGARTVGQFNLVANQGLTIDDIAKSDWEPRFKCYQNENFIINLSAAGNFQGAIAYSYKT